MELPPPNVYIPMGHGAEIVPGSRDIIPDNCSLIVLETCGGLHKMNIGLHGIQRMKTISERDPELKHKLLNPKEHISLLHDIFSEVAVYTSGDRCPDLKLQLLLDWKTPDEKLLDICYSGLIPFENFVRPDFNYGSILHAGLFDSHRHSKSTAEEIIEAINVKDDDFDHHYEWLTNKHEIYKYSVYPSPADFEKYFGFTPSIDADREKRIQLFKDQLNTGMSYEDSGEPLANLDLDAKWAFNNDMFRRKLVGNSDNLDFANLNMNSIRMRRQGFINVSLISLMRKFPGTYIHMVCRHSSANLNSQNRLTQEEISTKRIPLMPYHEQIKAIRNIERRLTRKNINLKTSASTKNINNTMLTALRRSVMHNELLKRTKGGRRRQTIKNK